MKNIYLMTFGFVTIFSGCEGTIVAIKLPNGELGKKLDTYVTKDTNDYLSESMVLKKAGIFTTVDMKTSSASNLLYVNVRRSDMNNRRSNVDTFTINDIKPSKCSYVAKGDTATRECIFDKKKIYTSYEQSGKLLYDENSNGKKSASVECLKRLPKPPKSEFIGGISWVAKMEDCISDAYQVPRGNGIVENKLGYNQLMYTNKHHLLDIGSKENFKQFLFGK